MSAKRSVLVILCPSHLHVYQRIMSDIERIRQLTKPLAHGDASLVSYLASCAHCHNQRKHHKDSHGIVDAIATSPSTMLTTRDARHTEQDGNQERAPPETTPHGNRLSDTRDEQAAKECRSTQRKSMLRYAVRTMKVNAMPCSL